MDMDQFCKKHNDKFVMICRNHNSPCCKVCVTEDHKLCKDITNIENDADREKTSIALSEIYQSVTELTEIIHNIRKERQENLLSISEQRIHVEKGILEKRLKINRYLDKIQGDILKELYDTEENENKKYKNLLATLEGKENEIKEIHSTISKVKQNTSDCRSYLALKIIENNVAQHRNYIQSLNEDKALNPQSITLKTETSFDKISSSIIKFSDIKVEDTVWLETDRDVSDDKQTQKKALHVSEPLSKILDKMTLQLDQSIDSDLQDIRGCCTLSDGRTVLTSYTLHGYVIALTQKGTKDFTTRMDWPCDVAAIQETNEIAVTSGGSGLQYISIIDDKSGDIKRKIPVGSVNYGIIRGGDTLYFCAGRKGLRAMNLSQKRSITDLKSSSLSVCAYVTTYENKLYYTNHDNHTVSCCDLRGSTNWTFKNEHVLNSPSGITVDKNGNVYVIGAHSHNVVVISSDGKSYKQVVSSDELHNVSCAIHFRRSSDQLLVVNYTGKMFVYKVYND